MVSCCYPGPLCDHETNTALSMSFQIAGGYDVMGFLFKLTFLSYQFCENAANCESVPTPLTWKILPNSLEAKI